jgi:hypothetical protein
VEKAVCPHPLDLNQMVPGQKQMYIPDAVGALRLYSDFIGEFSQMQSPNQRRAV